MSPFTSGPVAERGVRESDRAPLDVLAPPSSRDGGYLAWKGVSTAPSGVYVEACVS